MKVDHVTAIVGDLDAASDAIGRLLGVGPIAETTLPGMKIHTFSLGGIELHVNAPVGPGPVAEHHARYGPGYHHVALRVERLDEALADLEGRGFRAMGAVVETAPGLREVFLDPHTTGGLFVQLVERRVGAASVLDASAVAHLAGQLDAVRGGTPR